MIDRSYLPFKVAREYQDRKMAKWMGFFLSTHTAGLDSELNKVDYTSEYQFQINYCRLNQLYSNQLNGIIAVPGQYYTGKVDTLTFNHVSLKTKTGFVSIPIKDIFN